MSTCEHGIDSQTGTCTECQIAGMQAENERLKETAKIAIQEIGAWSRKAGKLEAENERLKEALQSLYDEQNGPPLIRYQKSWEAAMDKAEQALKGGKP